MSYSPRENGDSDLMYTTPRRVLAAKIHNGFTLDSRNGSPTKIASSPGEGRRGRPRAEQLNSLIQEGCVSPSSIKCGYCGRVFPREKSLQAHLRTHTGEKPYVCNYPSCPRRFAQSGQLKTHQRLHTGEQPFICSVVNCNRRFTHANRHCQIHPDAQLKRVQLPVSELDKLLDDQENETHKQQVRSWFDNVKQKKKASPDGGTTPKRARSEPRRRMQNPRSTAKTKLTYEKAETSTAITTINHTTKNDTKMGGGFPKKRWLRLATDTSDNRTEQDCTEISTDKSLQNPKKYGGAVFDFQQNQPFKEIENYCSEESSDINIAKEEKENYGVSRTKLFNNVNENIIKEITNIPQYLHSKSKLLLDLDKKSLVGVEFLKESPTKNDANSKLQNFPNKQQISSAAKIFSDSHNAIKVDLAQNYSMATFSVDALISDAHNRENAGGVRPLIIRKTDAGFKVSQSPNNENQKSISALENKTVSKERTLLFEEEKLLEQNNDCGEQTAFPKKQLPFVGEKIVEETVQMQRPTVLMSCRNGVLSNDELLSVYALVQLKNGGEGQNSQHTIANYGSDDFCPSKIPESPKKNYRV